VSVENWVIEMTSTNIRYRFFKEQKERFVEALKKAYSNINLLLNWNDVSLDNPGNWFIMFAPMEWGRFIHGFSGIHYTFAYRQERNGSEYVRLSLGVEKPLKSEFKKDFKIDVISLIKSKGLHFTEQFDLWPDAGVQKGTKLLETRTPLNENAWKEIFDRYLSLDTFNDLVGEVIRRYNIEGKFTEKLSFR